jgi:hypothetical protein
MDGTMNERDIRISGLLGTLELLPEGHPTRRIYEGYLRELGVEVPRMRAAARGAQGLRISWRRAGVAQMESPV